MRLEGPVDRGSVPNFHAFRHSAASWAIANGESPEEVSWQLGHKSSVVTRVVYLQEVKSAERTAHRRARMEAQYGPLLANSVLTTDGSTGQQQATPDGAEVRSLSEKRNAAQ
jgi:integrase